MVLEFVVHLIEYRHDFRDTEIHPDDLVAALILTAEEVGQLVEMDSEALVHVLFSGALPADVLLVLAVTELEVIFHEVPVYRRCGRQTHPVLGLGSQHVQPIVLVQYVDNHRLDPAYYLLSVLEVRQFNSWVLLQQLRVIFLLPLFLSQKYVFSLLVRNEYVLKYQADDFCLSSDCPIH